MTVNAKLVNTMSQKAKIYRTCIAPYQRCADTHSNGPRGGRFIAQPAGDHENTAGEPYVPPQHRDVPAEAILAPAPRRSAQPGASSRPGGQMVKEAGDRPLQSKLRGRKVAQIRLSPLARWILQHTGAGLARSKIAQEFYGLEPFYSGGYADPCLGPREKRERQAKCRSAQPAITKALQRLESVGLVELVCRNRYVKAVRLTQRGRLLAEELNNATESAGHKKSK